MWCHMCAFHSNIRVPVIKFDVQLNQYRCLNEHIVDVLKMISRPRRSLLSFFQEIRVKRDWSAGTSNSNLTSSPSPSSATAASPSPPPSAVDEPDAFAFGFFTSASFLYTGMKNSALRYDKGWLRHIESFGLGRNASKYLGHHSERHRDNLLRSSRLQ